MTKPTKWHVGPAKTQISLGCPGLSESLLGAQSFCWFCHGGGVGLRFFGCPILRIFTLFILSTIIIFTKETDFFNVISNVPYL